MEIINHVPAFHNLQSFWRHCRKTEPSRKNGEPVTKASKSNIPCSEMLRYLNEISVPDNLIRHFARNCYQNQFASLKYWIKFGEKLNKTAGKHRYNFRPNTNILINICKQLKTRLLFKI